MRDVLTQAQPPMEFISPDFTPWVFNIAKAALPLWMKLRTDLVDIQADNVETLAELYQQFQAQKIRFLIAFRHPKPEDSYAIAHLLWSLVPQAARQHNIPLQSSTHAHFLYDRGIPLWAGEFVGWIYQKLGGIPIQRGKVDRAGLRSARDLFANGQFPMAASPEGGNNGHSGIVSPLEPGVAQMGFWCVEDLHKQSRPESVLILPLSLQYHYLTPPWDAIEALLNQLERDSGLAQPSRSAVTLPNHTQPDQISPSRLQDLYQRLFGLGEHLLSIMQQFYADYYPESAALSASSSSASRSADATESAGATATAANLPNAQLAETLNNLLNVALHVAEHYFQLTPKGSMIDRCRRLEQAGWERIYRDDLKTIDQLSPVQKGLADRVAEEASLRMWHMRIVETFVAVTGEYVKEQPSADRFAETLMLLRDMVVQIKGEKAFPRPSLGAQQVKMRVGTPLSVSDRWPTYRQSRRQAIEQLTQDLQAALEELLI
ncbi:MAG: 1-acyl-sn-glycerol-3-phosphate acyltransferase [Thainema sp.]